MDERNSERERAKERKNPKRIKDRHGPDGWMGGLVLKDTKGIFYLKVSNSVVSELTTRSS